MIAPDSRQAATDRYRDELSFELTRNQIWEEDQATWEDLDSTLFSAFLDIL